MFDACHGWARHSSESEAGAALLARHGKALYESLEAPLARLGISLLEAARVEPSDWRMAGQFESLIELYAMISRRLEGVPTMTDIAGGLAAARQRAEAARDHVVALAEQKADPFTSSHSLLFRA